MKRGLADLSDEVWERIRTRLDGLSDEEYLWEPTQGCWSIRQREDGSWTADWPLPRPDPEPFTTIAWRLWHLIDMYGEDRAPHQSGGSGGAHDHRSTLTTHPILPCTIWIGAHHACAEGCIDAVVLGTARVR